MRRRLQTIHRGAWGYVPCATMLAFAFTNCPAHAQWPQWGGPQRNFIVDAKGLAAQWTDEGPKKIWSRDLGDGYATVVVDDGKLYTMYRVGEEEFTIALDAASGKTLWEHKNPSPFTKEMAEFGPGPHATPLVAGNSLYSIGTNMVMHAFDKSDGKVLWKHDLAEEYKADQPGRGYSSSPLTYKDAIIVPVGGKEDHPGQCIMAFDRSDGKLVWKNQSFEITHSSPILITFDGEDQLVIFMSKEIAGLNPNNGELLWSHPHLTQYGANLMTPVWNGGDLIFCSAAYDSGSRVVKLTKKDGKTVPEELWFNKKMRMHHTNPVCIGDYIYGSSGDFGPAFLFCVNAKTGELAWRERGFSKATCVYADGKLVLLDEDGQLAMAKVSPKGLEVLSKCQLLERTSWAAPSLAGTTLYVRDRKKIMALDLGAGQRP